MVLSAAQMARMSRLLDEALLLDEAGRRQWLRVLDPEHHDLDAALRRALLADGKDGGQVRAALLQDTINRLAPEIAALKPGERVGPYELVRELGAGGMAEVWLARRADGAFKREVALKLPMLTRLRKDLASRFARERDILAGLEHPNIARLYDAGVSSEGLPYLAMEYVHGQPLTAWCDAHRLGIRERLKLFLQVLDAVQYAHGHQVIHRDIKPSNILVSDAGEARLLDFGVAKLLAEEDKHTELTQIYGRALTPDYASPELVRGESIDAGADVYSLGVVLYELLAGSRPYRLKSGASITSLEQAIVTAQVERPSTQLGADAATARATSQQKLARRLRGDLDAIVLKALAKAPADRYRSAEALADDAQRYLFGEPVEARPDSAAYRLSKLVLRHRVGVSAAVAGALVIGALSYELIRREPLTPSPTPSAQSPTSQSGTAVPVAADDKSIAVLPFLDMSEKRDQEYFSDGLSEEVLDLLSRVPGLHVIARTSAFSFKRRSDDIPTIARKLLVANVLEGSVRKSGNRLRVTVQLVRAENGYHLWSETYDRTVGDVFKIQREIAASVAQALKVSLLDDSLPNSSVERSTEAYTLYLQARAIHLNALTPFEQQKEIDYLHKALELDPSFARAWALLSIALRVQVELQAEYGYPTGRQRHEDARQAARRAIALDPRSPDGYTAMARVLAFLDWNWSDAQEQVRRALALDRNYSLALALKGTLAHMEGRFDEALPLQEKAVANDPVNWIRYWDLGESYLYAGRYSDALVALRKARDLYPRASLDKLGLATVLLLKGETAAALAENEREPKEQVRDRTWVLAYEALGRRADADSALVQYVTKYSATHPYGVAQVHAYRGQIDEAFRWLDRAFERRDVDCLEVKVDPLFKNLHPDPRFKVFLRRMNLPQ